jgi:hypothetical protein
MVMYHRSELLEAHVLLYPTLALELTKARVDEQRRVARPTHSATLIRRGALEAQRRSGDRRREVARGAVRRPVADV